MTAVWRVARAAVRKRRLQTIVIGVVAAVSTATIVLALGLLVSSSAPFDRAHAQQDGADLVVAYDPARVSAGQLTAAADTPRVTAVAGPFALTTLDTSASPTVVRPSLTTVGRADPNGPVDRLNLWQGRWATAPGEITLSLVPGTDGGTAIGDEITPANGPALTIVGFAYSVSASADAWVTPAQLTELGPTATQMLYRLSPAATTGDIDAGQAAVTAGLPAKSVLGAQSFLAVKEQLTSEVGVYIPFLAVFGILGLVVSVLIVGNVVSGAVVSSYRDIGVLKAVGFSPNQVMAVYLVMVTVPSAIGCVLGAVAGNLVVGPMLADTVQVFGATPGAVDPWVTVVAVLGMPAVVCLTALVSALRARRLPAAAAISAGSAPRLGRAPRLQRWLSGVRLPRSVSLGIGMPFARPARSALTLAAVVLGVLTVTLAIGVMLSVTAYNDAMRPYYPDRLEVLAGPPPGPRPEASGGTPTRSDAEIDAALRDLPGTQRVSATAERGVQTIGGQQRMVIRFARGDTAALGPRVLSGRWPTRAGEVAAPSRFLNQRGLAVGDTMTVELDGRRTEVRVVGVVLTNNPETIFADWATLTRLAPDARAEEYTIQLAPSTDRQSYVDSVTGIDPALAALPPRDRTSDQALVLIGSATLLTVVLGAVAALGVFNTVVLNARERRRDLGMLKSIGMTPRQVTVMMVSSMGSLGIVGGLIGVPLGVLAHSVVGPAMMRAAQSDVFDFVVDVYHAPTLVLLALAGIGIAVLGAVIPARSAARVPIATVLHNE